jgi:pimeloyl-ACP methyl ester carboxylesterase
MHPPAQSQAHDTIIGATAALEAHQGISAMPFARIDADLEMHYLCDDFTDPWREAETILMLHGNSERGEVWFAWVPHLARHYRVVRPDMRGFGESTPMPVDFSWSLDRIVDDYVELMRKLHVSCCHLIAAKLGGTVARRLAARYPGVVRTLVVAGTPQPNRDHVRANIPGWMEEFSQENGVEKWARRTMAGRLGDRFPVEGVEWWAKLMGRTPASTQLGFMKTVPVSDITADLPNIKCPTLVITTEGSALGSVDDTRVWQRMIPNSELLVLPGNSYHVAASDADVCAQAALAFIKRN